MKLATFDIMTEAGPIRRIGLIQQADAEDAAMVVDLQAAYAARLAATDSRPHPERWAAFLLPPELRAFLELGEPSLDAARHVQDAIDGGQLSQDDRGLHGERLFYPLSGVALQSPVPNPRMLRDFLAFEAHTAKGFEKRNEPIPEAWYKMPVYYKGNPNTLIGHNMPVHWPGYTRRFDYELELACIIGREGRNIPVEEAGRYIAGYAIMNDFSARDIQKGEMLCRLGPAKAKDFATAVGPWLVTADDIPDPAVLGMRALVNGELWSEGSFGTCHWTFAQMIAHVSQDETLYPGDILGSGTVGGGSGFEIDRWLQPNDTVELAIDGLGILRNRVIKSGVVQSD